MPKARPPHKPGRPGLMVWGAAAALVTVIVLGLLVVSANRSTSQTAHAAPLTETAGPVPGWLTSADRAVVADYTWAASHHDALKHIPCYCGCFESAGHVNNSECYFKRTAAGQIAGYDRHAVG